MCVGGCAGWVVVVDMERKRETNWADYMLTQRANVQRPLPACQLPADRASAGGGGESDLR